MGREVTKSSFCLAFLARPDWRTGAAGAGEGAADAGADFDDDGAAGEASDAVTGAIWAEPLGLSFAPRKDAFVSCF